ncbi:hypothetical protein ANN_19699 [Periplaneta americana]|uniref:Uncharacterized protein n=1 Tax=Periplaneta americana TaxID=6978 RepID=A0ABQ8SB59_PERAM|nr:hypothetical protein ANN_19699 [Periplaneta americana]
MALLAEEEMILKNMLLKLNDNYSKTAYIDFLHAAYQDMLSEWLVPQLQQAGTEDTVVLQQDGVQHTSHCKCADT